MAVYARDKRCTYGVKQRLTIKQLILGYKLSMHIRAGVIYLENQKGHGIMQRWSDERFIEEKYNMDKIAAVRVMNGEFYFIAWMEVSPDYSIKAAKNVENCRINPDYIILMGDIMQGIYDSDGYGEPCYILYETDSDGNPVKGDDRECGSSYEVFLSLVKCHERNGVSDKDDHDIFFLTKDEVSSICVVLRDGEYVFVINEG